MRLIRLTAEYIDEVIAGKIGVRGPQLESCALTLGSFDGLHLGHQELIKGVQAAKQRQCLAADVVFTFLQHPRQVLDAGGSPFLLTTWREKLAVLESLSCQVVVAADFCPALARLGYREFVEKFLVRYLGMKYLVAGHDVHLGADRRGTAQTLAALGKELGFTLEVFSPVHMGSQTISSSAIRNNVLAGQLPSAAAMLGRPYSLWGDVRPGERRGRQMGYPTANVMPLDENKLVPEPGVYAAYVQVPGDVVGGQDDQEGQGVRRVIEALPEVDRSGALLGVAQAEWVVYGGMLNFGLVPTFHRQGLAQPRLEAHIFGFTGDLRGRLVKVEWIQRLRSERTFASSQDLVAQLQQDELQARKILDLPAGS